MVSVFFYLIAAVMVGAALVVVTSRNVVRAALALIVVFAGVAAQFILLAAEFVAVTQVLVYIGAIMVLMLFGIMLTRARIGRDVDATNDHWWSGRGHRPAAAGGHGLRPGRLLRRRQAARPTGGSSAWPTPTPPR